MELEEIFDTVSQIVADVFGEVSSALDIDLSIQEIEDWTSLRHILIIHGIEKHYNIKYLVTDFEKLTSLRIICESIQQKLNNR